MLAVQTHRSLVRVYLLEIPAVADMGPARVLRTLATNHIFLEVSPDVFANNRISSCIDTGKPVKEIIAQ